MSDVIKIKKGLDIKLKGSAEKHFAKADQPERFAVKPTDFHGLTPKLIVKAGETVKAGTPLFFDKYRPEIKFVSPVSGTVEAINRGERRRILEVVVKADATTEYETFEKAAPSTLSREQVKQALLNGGVWPFIIQRPYDVIANPGDTPKAIFISGFDTAPLAPDMDFVMVGQEADFQTGIDALAQLTDGKIHVGVHADAASKVFVQTKGVEVTRFMGAHPAGNVGVQIHHVDPLNKGELVWVVKPQDVVAIGRLFSKGFYDASRVMALVGSEVKKPAYYRMIQGASIASIVANNVAGDKTERYISGNVLSGTKISGDGYIGAYDTQVTVIPEGDEHEFFGWALPGLKKFSVHRTFFSWLCSSKKGYTLNANMHGGERAFVMAGEYDRFFPMDILPEFLLKAILVEDIDKMEQLGIYEVAPEDFALCEYACTSKIETQKIVRQGLDLMMKELG